MDPVTGFFLVMGIAVILVIIIGIACGDSEPTKEEEQPKKDSLLNNLNTQSNRDVLTCQIVKAVVKSIIK
jgi:hypothetical protein